MTENILYVKVIVTLGLGSFKMENALIFAVSIFVITYGLIISEKVDRVVVSILGATVMIVSGILTQDDAIGYMDFNTIGLLIGMMIMINVIKESGVFEALAIYFARLAKGDPWKILLLLSLFTAISSAFLNNVTIILLIVPITLFLTEALEVKATPFLFAEVFLSNVGGAATVIGDPPNTLIANAVGISFNTFFVNIGPVIIFITIVFLVMFKLLYGKDMVAKEENKARIMKLNPRNSITDMKLLVKGVIMLFLTILGFIFYDALGLELATIALFGASVLMAIAKPDVNKAILEVEWATILFFLALFVLVGSLEHVGAIDIMAQKMIEMTKGNIFVTTMAILWGAALLSAFLDNIPLVATMIPLIMAIEAQTGTQEMSYWWALALGACLGGNGSLVGATPNVVVAGIMEKRGAKVSFGHFLKIGFPFMLVSIIISTIYLIVFYL